MKSIKAAVVFADETSELNRDANIQNGLETLIRRLVEFPADRIKDLNFDPVEVKNKIQDDVTLMIEVQSLATAWYPTVNDIFKSVAAEKAIRYNALSSEIAAFWENLAEAGRTKSQIYEALIEWFQDKTNSEAKYCRIVVAFFIQKCEVFHAVTE